MYYCLENKRKQRVQQFNQSEKRHRRYLCCFAHATGREREREREREGLSKTPNQCCQYNVVPNSGLTPVEDLRRPWSFAYTSFL